MTQKHQVHNLIILDESGSMESIKPNIIQGFNELVQNIRGIEKQFPEQEHYISFITFNGLRKKLHHFMAPVRDLHLLDAESYMPNSMTPLYDAMGLGINKLKQALYGEANHHVLVTILTDGAENDSKEFSGKDIQKLVEDLKQKRWTFTYIGTDHDVVAAAKTLSIDSTLDFPKSAHGIVGMLNTESRSRLKFCRFISEKKDPLTNYFEMEDEEQEGEKKG